MESSATASATGETIICPVTPWYFRRMGLLSGMLLLMGLYFLYDGMFGYPKANTIAEKKEWFEKELLPSYDAAKAAGTLETWTAETKAKGWPAGRAGEAPRWVSWAAENNWPEKPDKYTDREIAEQFWWGGGTLLAALGVAVVILINRGKVLRGEADHWVTPDGRTIRYAEAFRIDKRPWAQKGLAYVWYRKGTDGKPMRTVIDDLKYHDASRVLERLLANFKGELIEKQAEPEDASASAPQKEDKPV